MILSMDYASPPPSDGRFVQARMTTRLPQIGETVMIAGFVASDERVPFLPERELKRFATEDGCLRYGLELRIGVGEVTDHYLNGRCSMLRAPNIQVACSTSHGMSGGAAFDKNGRVFGVLSSALYTDSSDRGYPSNVSLALLALVQKLTPAFLPQQIYSGHAESVALIDLPPHLCGIDERAAVYSSTDAETGLIRVEVRNW